MLTRHFTISRRADSQGRHNFILRAGGSVPELEIERELLQIVFEHNDAYTAQGRKRDDLSPTEFSRIHELGPVLYKVAAVLLDSSGEISRLGGMFVPANKIDRIRAALEARSYTLTDEPE